MKKTVFLDRDGTIIDDVHYPKDKEKITLLPKAAEGLRALVEKDYQLIVISNQSGVGRGIISDFQFREVHNRFIELLKEEEVLIEHFAYCFHLPEDHCKCRKPETKMIEKFLHSHSIDIKNSYMVGDKECDILLGKNMQLNPILVTTGKGKQALEDLKDELKNANPYFQTCDNLLDFALKLEN
jgi:histidinol-phosphate phosphatase family protein